MSETIRKKYVKELGWKVIFLYLGFFIWITPILWVIQFLIYQIKFESNFFNLRFYKISYYSGILIAIIWTYTFIETYLF